MSNADISNSNCYFGLYAGSSNNIVGTKNVYFGYNSGTNVGTSTKSTFIGATTAQTAGQPFTMSAAIGFGANATATNQMVLGTPSEYVLVSGTAASSSQTTGALQISGGLGISGDIYCRNMYGGAAAVPTVSDNTNTKCYIPFTKTAAGPNANSPLYIDDTTGPLTYNPSTSVLSCDSLSISGYASTANPVITTTATLLPTQSGGFVELQGAAPYTVTLPDPSGTNNGNLCYKYTIWLNPATTTTTITLATPTGLFYGPAGNGLTTFALTQAAYGQYLYIASDRFNWFVYANNAVTTVSDNTNTTCYIPFTNAQAGPNQTLRVDDATGPLTYNPSTATMSLGSINASGNLNITGNLSNGVNFSAGSGGSALGYASFVQNYSNTAAVGDLVLRADTNKRLILQSGSGAGAIIIDGTNAVLMQPGYTTLPTFTSSQIGYQVSATISTGNLTSATVYNFGSITLGIGVWIVEGNVAVQGSSAVDVTTYNVGISTASNSFSTLNNETRWGNGSKLVTIGSNTATAQYFSQGTTKVLKITASATHYLLGYFIYASGTLSPVTGGSYFTATRIA